MLVKVSWTNPSDKLQQVVHARSYGSSLIGRTRNALESSLKKLAKDASILQLCMCLGRREGPDDRAVLPLPNSLWLEGARGNSCRPRRQVFEDARCVEQDRSEVCQLGAGRCF